MRVRIRTAAAAALVTGILFQPATPALQERTGVVRLAPDSMTALRAWDDRVDAMIRARSLERFQTRQDTLVAGRTHERLRQYYGGVPVFGGEVVRQLEGGVTVSIFGSLYEGIELDTAPALSPDAARTRVTRATGATMGAGVQPALMVLPLEDGRYALVYRLQVFANGDLRVYFVDAGDGRIVKEYSNLQTAEVGRGVGVLGDPKKVSVDTFGGTYVASDGLRPPVIVTYDMRGDVQRTIDFLNGVTSIGPNDVASDADNVWADGAAVDAHTYAGYTYDYFFKQFGRMGLDNRDVPIRSLVHPLYRNAAQSAPGDIVSFFLLNAFYVPGGVVVYGDGLPPDLVLSTGLRINYFAGALDVVAHELTHGVTDYSSGLIYEGESGALNEAFSDMMGTSAEFFFQPAGTGLMQADYLIGEDIWTPGGLRSMSNPAAYGDPDHYSRRYTGSEDDGGVHTNSAIPNQAFYLAIEGGRNRTSGLAVQGVGGANRAQIERAFYRAFVFLLPSDATFAVARSATIQAARDLYGPGSSAEQAVTEAWTAVGVN